MEINMGEIRYIISDASKKIDVEQYTLRYWEEELNLDIQRNEMGHRYYREEDLEVFKAIKNLKDKGYQLRAIKMMLPEIIKFSKQENLNLRQVQEEWDKNQIARDDNEVIVAQTGDKLDTFKSILGNLMVQALEDNNERLSLTISDNVTSSVIKEMDYLLRIKEEREEERFKQFDRTLREMQSGRQEIAATKVFKNKKKKMLFSNYKK
jgi:DNA-binding transcriptional MerR regulator